jgi:hypothetical protein
MHHLGSAKIAAELCRTYFWPTLKPDTVRILKDCPQCGLEKARQTTAHALFAARPQDAPRSRWAMDFQGQGLAETGETQALALLDTTARFAVVIPLPDREATTFIPKFLDEIVFKHGVPDILHSARGGHEAGHPSAGRQNNGGLGGRSPPGFSAAGDFFCLLVN